MAIAGGVIAALLGVALAGCAGAGGGEAGSVGPGVEEPAAALQRFEYRKVVMAIGARVVLYAPDEAMAKAAANAAFAELERLDAVFSDYREDSELMRLCRAQLPDRRDLAAQLLTISDPYPSHYVISRDLWSVLALSLFLEQRSEELFCVGAGGLIDLWSESRRTGLLPDEAAIRDAVRHRRMRVMMPGEVGAIQIGHPLSIDLGGIAKGYALGAALDVLRVQGVPRALVEMGGDLVVGEAPPGEEGWLVGVHSPSGGVAGMTALTHSAAAVSGAGSQSTEIDGVDYSHVVNPRTGWPLTDGLQCAVVMPLDSEPLGRLVAPFLKGNWSLPRTLLDVSTTATAAALADALATTATLMGAHQGREFVESLGATHVRLFDPAFRPLFDGTSLSNWTPRGGRYDGDALWSVEDGAITGRTGPGDAGGLLYTQAPFTSFELQLECQLEPPFDSGIFVRMAPDARGAQLTLDDRPDGEIGALYSDGFLAHARPEAAAAWRRGEWNHVFLRCTGFDMRIEAWINGVPVMDHVVPQEFGPDGRPTYAPSGLIGLQVHGGGSEGAGHKVRFREITIRELPVHGEDFARDRALAPPEREARAARRAADGWHDLLAPAAPDADPLSAWEDIHDEGPPHAPTDYSIRDGVLHIPSSDPPGYLRTKADFRDFDLTLQFRQARLSNSGLFLRGRRDAVGPDGALVPGGNPAYSGCEIQIIDDWNWEAGTQSTLKDWQFTGSLYGAVPPARKGLLAPIGEWNVLEVTARGSRLACALNGQALWDVDTHALAVEPPFAARAAKGFLGLQRYAAPGVTDAAALEVRELWVRER